MSNNCHDCGAKPGEYHKSGCDVERCPFCGRQLISCSCVLKLLGQEFGWKLDPSKPYEGLPKRVYNEGLTPEMEKRWEEHLVKEGKIPWTGLWPGDAECIEYGFYSYFGPVPKGEDGAGRWVPCSKDHPGAGPDLNRLMAECVWSRKLKKFVLKPKQKEEEPAR